MPSTRNIKLTVYVNAEEQTKLEALAIDYNLPLSRYMRVVSLGDHPGMSLNDFRMFQQAHAS